MRRCILIAILGSFFYLSLANNYPWTKQTMPQSGINPPFSLKLGPCSDIDPIKTATYGSKLIEFHYCGEDWRSAQTLCISRGGKLWTPSSNTEYESVFQAIDYDVGGVPEARYSGSNGIWIPKPKSCESITSYNITLVKQNCNFKQPFICEVKPYCSCKYGANEYPCNRQITVLHQCCLDVFCDPQGRIK
eukprot:TCALIF_09284-PA protein Name:"Protein of unknown function" AED:0.11 eAED:0.11 QI:41/0.66/0.5/1/0.33/0.5/4/0/189